MLSLRSQLRGVVAVASRAWPVLVVAALGGCGTNASSPGASGAMASSETGQSGGAGTGVTGSGVTGSGVTGQSGGIGPSGMAGSSSGSGPSGATGQSGGTGAGAAGGVAGSSGLSGSAAEPLDATTEPEASSEMDGAVTSAGEDAGPADAGPPAVRFVARVDRTNAMGPRFAWSGSTILARFTGSSIGIDLMGPTTYFDVSIDGTMQAAPLLLQTGTTSYPLATGLAAGPHELTVYRRNEPGISTTGDTTYLGLILDPAGGALLPPSLPSTRRIEIVGDSVTSGYGNESVGGQCPNALLSQNYDVAYGAVAARTVNADLITIAWTGKGMYRNNQGDTTLTMPILYGRTLPDITTSTWDFTSWIPDAVVIYLGNNDFGKGDPGQPYVTTYNTFIARVRTNYPKALIICTIGPNLSGTDLTEERAYVQGIVTAENTAGDMNVVFLEMPQPTAAEGTGCGGHPLAVTHARMGAALAALLQMKLGW
jgi:lysophospholipase L1-like esterase